MKRKLLLAALCVVGALGMRAQTDVTSQYLTNANLNGTRTEQLGLNGNDRYIYKPDGWTVDYSSGGQWDMTAMNADDKQWNSQFQSKAQPVNGGDKVYFIRFRYGGPTINLHQTTNASLPVGTYRVSADAYRTGGNGTATLSAGGKSVTIDTRNVWANYSIVFTLTTASEVTISFQFTGSGESAIAGVDNFKLENITQGVSDISHDWTSTIANAGFELGTSGTYGSGQNVVNVPKGYTLSATMDGWRDGSINTTNPSEGSKLYNYWAGTTTALDIYQAVSLPVGKYTISADLRTEDGKISDQGVYAKIGETINKSGTIQTIGDPWNSSTAWNKLSKDFYVEEDGTVQLGASSTGGAKSVGWFQIDNFQLTYKGAVQNTPYSITSATATAVTADQWYAVEIPAEGDYRIISNADKTVYYTQNGYYAASDVTDPVTLNANVKKVVTLTKGKLYIRSTTDATLTIEPDTYSYSVGTATPSVENVAVANDAYVQNNTLTITFDASTNDPDGALSILDDTKIKVNDEAATASLDGNVLTITLASTLATSTDYAVSIEAGAVGYNDENTNDAFSLTLHTPAVFDGTFFIATTDGKQFISRGGDSRTEAVLDKFGIAVNVTTDASNVTNFVFVDNDKNLFGGSSSIYTDKNATDLGNDAPRKNWTVAAVDGGYTLRSIQWNKYIKAGIGAESGAEAATYSDDSYTWVLEAPTTHKAKMVAYKDANAAAVAAAVGLNVTTVADLKTALESYFTKDNENKATNTYSSVTEKYQPNEETVISEQEITGLKNGVYKVSLSVFHRIRDYAGTYTLNQADADNPTAYLYANGQKVQLPSPLSESSDNAYTSQDSELGGKHYPNGTVAAGEAFTAGKYKVEVFAVVTDGTLKLGLKNPAKYSNANWICWRDLAVTAYTFNGDYTDLATAISTAESNLGFESGEYAPYNNIESMGKLAAAKALYASQDALNQAEINAALTGVTWTANEGDLDAIFNGMFDSTVEGDWGLTGWTRTNGWGQQQTGLSGDYATAYYNQPGSLQYGNKGLYTMPLAADTWYTLTFAYRSHEIKDGKGSNKKVTVSVLNGEDGLAATVFPGNGSTSEWKTVTKYFQTGAAGNYVLTLANEGNTWMTGVSLKKGIITTANPVCEGYKTFYNNTTVNCEAPEGTIVYIATVPNNNGYVHLTEVEDNIVPVGKAVILKTTLNKEEETDVATDIVLTPTATASSNDFTPNALYAASEDGAVDGAYVLGYYDDETDGGLGFYQYTADLEVGDIYLLASNPANVRLGIVVDGEATAINSVKAEAGKANEATYNMAGQRVNGSYKGIVIKNGKKYMIK